MLRDLAGGDPVKLMGGLYKECVELYNKEHGIDAVKGAFAVYLERNTASDVTKKYVSQFLDEHFPQLEEAFQTLRRRPPLHEIFAQWVNGEFTYESSLFDSPKEITEYVRYMDAVLKAVLFAGEANRIIIDTVSKAVLSAGEANQIISTATEQLTARILQHEQRLQHKEQARARREEQAAAERSTEEQWQKKQQEAAAKEQHCKRIEKERLEAKKAKYVRRGLSPATPATPYKLASDVAQMMKEMHSLGQTSGKKAPAARLLCSIVEDACHVFATNDKEVQELAKQILSFENIAHLASAFELRKSLNSLYQSN